MPPRLIRLQGPQTRDEWEIPRGTSVIGRRLAGGASPAIDLWPDRRVSRAHLKIAVEDESVSVRETGSRNGTIVRGRALRPEEHLALRDGDQFCIGDTRLLYVSAGTIFLRTDEFGVTLQLPQRINPALVAPEGLGVRWIRAYNLTTHSIGSASIALQFAGGPMTRIEIRPMGEEASTHVGKADLQMPAAVRKPSHVRRTTEMRVGLQGSTKSELAVPLTLLASDEWPVEDPLALAAFVRPHDPVVVQVANQTRESLAPNADGGAILATVVESLRTRWQIDYCLEPPSDDGTTQRIRSPGQILDQSTGKGRGTCIDLALLVASICEALHAQPLVRIIDHGATMHALAGCWRSQGNRIDPLPNVTVPASAIAWNDLATQLATGNLAGHLDLGRTGLTVDLQAARHA